MRDKVRENVLSALRKGIKLNPEGREWLLRELKQVDNLRHREKLVISELSKIELMLASNQIDEAKTHICKARDSIFSTKGDSQQ